jgi:hypothetical protein
MSENPWRRVGVTMRPSVPLPPLLLALLLSACTAAGSSTDDSNNAKNHGFYGGVNGGWSHP